MTIGQQSSDITLVVMKEYLDALILQAEELSEFAGENPGTGKKHEMRDPVRWETFLEVASVLRKVSAFIETGRRSPLIDRHGRCR